MSEFHEGDLVEAVKGETVIRGRVVRPASVYRLGDSGRTITALENEGFTLTVIEKAAPTLPTEPGVYRGWDGAADCSILVLVQDGYIYLPDAARFEGIGGALADPERFVPFTRLEPVPVTAKRVLDAIRQRIGSIDSAHDFQAVAAEFGVTE